MLQAVNRARTHAAQTEILNQRAGPALQSVRGRRFWRPNSLFYHYAASGKPGASARGTNRILNQRVGPTAKAVS